jgi:hypothetical protein
MFNSSFSRIDLNDGTVIFPINGMDYDCKFTLDAIPMDKIGDRGATQLKKFIQLLLFIELSDTGIELLEPNQKTGTRKSGKVFNQTKTKIVVVDSKWNTMSVRTEGFLVSGHWRMQPCGTGMMERRIIWIDSFQKNGYVKGRSKSNIKIN